MAPSPSLILPHQAVADCMHPLCAWPLCACPALRLSPIPWPQRSVCIPRHRRHKVAPSAPRLAAQAARNRRPRIGSRPTAPSSTWAKALIPRLAGSATPPFLTTLFLTPTQGRLLIPSHRLCHPTTTQRPAPASKVGREPRPQRLPRTNAPRSRRRPGALIAALPARSRANNERATAPPGRQPARAHSAAALRPCTHADPAPPDAPSPPLAPLLVNARSLFNRAAGGRQPRGRARRQCCLL
jgi:hypothetical protein